jgi:hypothetical protein
MICADGTMVELVEPQRYESQKQHITARLELVGPGMVLLIWDNSFSWLNTKQLAYTIELTQETPEISAERKTALAQRARYDRERALLSKDTELDRLQTTIEAHDQSIEFFKKQIEGLQEQLHKREEEKEASEKQKQSVEEQIETLAWEIRGTMISTASADACSSSKDTHTDLLCGSCTIALNWRSLDKAVLSNVFTFLSESDRTAWYLSPICTTSSFI